MQRYISGFYGLDIYLYAEIQIIFGTVYCVHAPKNLPFCRNARHLKRKQLEESIGECGVVYCGRVESIIVVCCGLLTKLLNVIHNNGLALLTNYLLPFWINCCFYGTLVHYLCSTYPCSFWSLSQHIPVTTYPCHNISLNKS